TQNDREFVARAVRIKTDAAHFIFGVILAIDAHSFEGDFVGQLQGRFSLNSTAAGSRFWRSPPIIACQIGTEELALLRCARTPSACHFKAPLSGTDDQVGGRSVENGPGPGG